MSALKTTDPRTNLERVTARDYLRISWPPELTSVLLTLAAVLLWASSIPRLDLNAMTGLGLYSVLPLPVYLAVGILIASFCLTLRTRNLSVPVLLLQYVVLVFILYGTPILAADLPFGHVPWRHAGITEYLMRGGNLDGRLEFYYNFPGFFILSAFFTSIAGLGNPIVYMAWAPIFFNLLYLGPLIMILNAGTTDRRVIVTGIWFFYLTNWVSQDYFVPQALNYFLYLVILGVLLNWFKALAVPTTQPLTNNSWIRRHAPFLLPLIERFAPTDSLNLPSGLWQRLGLAVILIVLAFFIVSSHPLTPWFLLMIVAALVFFRRVTPRGLPIIIAVLIATWLAYMAVPYLESAHAAGVVRELGNVSTGINENVAGRVHGDSDHVFIVFTRFALTASVWGLAGLGGIFSLMRRRWYPSHLLLAGVPFSLLMLQPYGGEMLLRCYLFALPAVAFFAAIAFFPTPKLVASSRTPVLIGITSLALVGAFLFARYGDLKNDTFTKAEYEAVQYLYDHTPPGSVIVTVVSDLPLKYEDYEKYRYLTITRPARRGEINTFVSQMQNDKYAGAALILTRSQELFAESYLGWDPESWPAFEQAINESGKFDLVFANEDSRIYVLASH